MKGGQAVVSVFLLAAIILFSGAHGEDYATANSSANVTTTRQPSLPTAAEHLLVCQSGSEYASYAPRHWWGSPRAYTDMKNIYVNRDAFYINGRDMELLIAHEWGHINGREHTPAGLMSAYGLVRYLTTKSYDRPNETCPMAGLGLRGLLIPFNLE